MSDHGPHDPRLEELLASALNDDPERTPPPERIAALRAQVEDRARAQHHASHASPQVVELASRPRRTGRRDVLMGGIAASIGAAIGVGGALALAGDDGDGPDAPPTEAISFAGAPPGVSAEAALINHTWGTELMLDIQGLPGGRDYQVLYSPAEGEPVAAGSFRSVDDTLLKCRFNASLLRADVTAMSIVDSDGAPVLLADLT